MRKISRVMRDERLQILRTADRLSAIFLNDRVRALSARSMLFPAGGTMVDSRGRAEMGDRTEDIYERLSSVEQKVDALAKSVDRRFDVVDRRFEEVAESFAEQRAYTDYAFERLNARISAREEKLEEKMDSGFARLDRKLDQLIDRA